MGRDAPLNPSATGAEDLTVERTVDGEPSRGPLFAPIAPAAARTVSGAALPPPASGRRLLRGTPLALAVLVVVQAVFSLIWIGATHSPKPHRIPIGIAADAATATRLAGALNGISGHPVTATPMTIQAADLALHEHRIDAVLAAGTANGTDTLFFADAAGPAETQLLGTTLGALDAGQNRRLQTVDAIPLPTADSNGLSSFFLVLSWIVAGILGALIIPSISGRAASTRSAVWRLASLAGYALACSLSTTGVAEVVYGVAKGQLAGTVTAGLAVTFATACATSAVRAAAGPRATLAVVIGFLAVGIPSAGALVPHHLLPLGLRMLGPFLLTGAGADLTRNVLYFGHHDVVEPLATLAAWIAVSVVLCVVFATRAQRRSGTTNNP